jgi:hypothetical protein
MSRSLLAFAAAGAILYALLRSAGACGTAGRAGVRVQIATESAVIFWDPRAKVQHFVRRANFTADTPDFGFLVPTPAEPTLAEAKDETFAFLEKLILPEVVEEATYEFLPPLGCGMGHKSAGIKDEVRVLGEQRVAGYDAVKLEADSARALSAWLTSHEYASRPDLTAWLEPYVKARWKITAFKIAGDASRQEVASSAVLMSFAADRPFFPYSEPADQHRSAQQGGGSRLLRVFFLADRRYGSTLGDSESWPGETVWAGPLKAEAVAELRARLDVKFGKGEVRPAKWSPMAGDGPVWLTVFEDRSSPRPGTADVFFAPSSDQTEIHQLPIRIRVTHVYGGWVCLGVLLLLLLVPILHLIRRARRASGQAPAEG